MISFKKFLLLSLLIILSSCGTLSDVGKTMRNEKIISNDEFLVKKKEPLTLPPDFAEIPEPGTLERKDLIEETGKWLFLKWIVLAVTLK